MFLVDWAVKIRIRPPEFETSICDANASRLPPLHIHAAAAAALRRRRLAPPPPRVAGIRSGRFDEENPFVQNPSVLLVQPAEGVSILVVDRIGDYLPQSTEKSQVLVIPVGARHKCQQELKTKFWNRSRRPPPPAEAHPPRAAAPLTRKLRGWWGRLRAQDAHGGQAVAASFSQGGRVWGRKLLCVGRPCVSAVSRGRAHEYATLLAAPGRPVLPISCANSSHHVQASCAMNGHAWRGRAAGARLCAAVSFCWWRPPAGRRSGEFPAIL
ncbi:hypothetical protein F511_22774 [Dorcoceras hygrometricum]|uniref:Uncharacterized protein n=1 Tax=Dorcoceras hygrometricum TaxID=472368 RepID=A0A2Z7AJP7_9LAMI|nr:hypothetical protein F511_22774 [Dorcoceras hygrometricum]